VCALGYGGPMDMPEGAEGHSVDSDGVGALIEGSKVAISQTRLIGTPPRGCKRYKGTRGRAFPLASWSKHFSLRRVFLEAFSS
jgi:hypothetical protein